MERNNKWKGKGRHFLYLLAALGMLFVALTRLEQGGSGEGYRLFWYTWLAFSAVIVAANINMLLFVSEEKRKELMRIKHARAVLRERSLEKLLGKRAGNRGKMRSR